MNIVSSSGRYQIYDDNVSTYKKLPQGCYKVNFNKFTGFYLTAEDDLTVLEEKIYGNSEEKVHKIFNSFSATNRNFGVILSGKKGIGKSLFVRLMAIEATNKDLPVILVNGYVPGIDDFISSLKQECLVIFDEFEKTFARGKDDDNFDPQNELLSLLDGLDNGKKLFVITCNDVSKLNSYFINRPGRFHYHITLGNPTPAEVEEYLKDKLLPEYYNQIDSVTKFAKIANVTYDYLRAIAFEINQGYTFSEAMQDLNITVDAEYGRFDVVINTLDGKRYTRSDTKIDVFAKDDDTQYITCYNLNECVGIKFKASDLKFNGNEFYLTGDKVLPNIDRWDYDTEEEYQEVLKKFNIANVIFTKVNYSSVRRYCV